MKKIKQIAEKPHNLMFIAASVVFLQFLATFIYYYMFYIQVEVRQKVENDMNYYIYIPYCIVICVVTGIFIAVAYKQKTKMRYVKMWFAGIFMYMLSEILLFAKMMMKTETVFDEVEFSDLSNVLYSDQTFFRLYLCIAVIFIIYCASYIIERKKIHLISAGANIVLFAVCMLSDFLLPSGGQNLFDAYFIAYLLREAGILIYMLNMFAFALYEFYRYKE